MKKFFIMIICLVVSVLIWQRCNVCAEETILDDERPIIYIKAVNPGYVIDKKNNVGEMIEIGKYSDTQVSLAGIAVGYTNSSGNFTTLLEFPENSFMTGETLILRLASSPDSELAALNYTRTIAMKGGLSLKKGDKVIDELCWTGKGDCYTEFKSSNPTTLVKDAETGLFEHVIDYSPVYDANSYYVEQNREEEGFGLAPSQCKKLEFSEILSYYETTKDEQFIELYNSSSEQIMMDGCKIRYKNKTYGLSGVVMPDEYYVYTLKGFNLTKNPTNSNLLELIDSNDELVDSLNYYNGQKKGAAFAMVGYDKDGNEIWKVTYAVTPGSANVFQEFKTCEEGKVINEMTGNCVKVASIQEKVCPEGQYLNILTGRCKKYDVEKAKTCKEGYYYNEETGRCRKIKENDGADYSLEPSVYEEQSSFVALYIILGIVGIGVIYVIYEFRYEIVRLWHKVFR